MRNYRLSVLCGFVSLFVLLNSSLCLGASPTKPASNSEKDQKQKIELLFVLSAAKGEVSKSEEGYRLILKSLNPNVLWFTDRPNRKAGYIKTDAFIDQWPKAFKGEPPNAAMLIEELSNEPRSVSKEPIAIEMMSLTLANNQVSIQIKPLNNTLTLGKALNIALLIDCSDLNVITGALMGAEKTYGGVFNSIGR